MGTKKKDIPGSEFWEYCPSKLVSTLFHQLMVSD